jgi:hypothetical protein
MYCIQFEVVLLQCDVASCDVAMLYGGAGLRCLILKILLFGAKESRTETMKVSKKSFDF